MTPEEEIELLRSRVSDLETCLRQTTGRDLALAFHLPPLMERLLGLLLVMPRVTSEVIEQRLNISTQPKIAIWRLRRLLSEHDIEIHSKRHLGYWLEQEDKEKLIKLSNAKHAAEPHHAAS